MVLLYELNIIYFYFKDKGDCWLWILLRDYIQLTNLEQRETKIKLSSFKII